MKEFQQIIWDSRLEDDCRQLIRLAIREDLDRVYDWTTVALVGESAEGQATVAARAAGVIAGLPAAQLVLAEYDARLRWSAQVTDGQHVIAGQPLATIAGSARSLLAVERPLLNLLGHLCGIATLADRYVAAVAGTRARIYDTRKTLPGWRRLEKYAVRMGGGTNHRLGLFDAVLIKDNHLALGASEHAPAYYTPAQAVRRAREFLAQLEPDDAPCEMLVEVEVDSLAQLAEVLHELPDIVLLDNMPPEILRQAVAMRDGGYAQVQLEASGGITLGTVRSIAEAGVDRISVGALTHSAQWFDVGLDWQP